MGFLTIFLIALGLAADCFAVALGCSVCRNYSLIQEGRVSAAFGVFQTVMPILGWVAGLTVVNFISSYDHWLALALLGFVGGKMIWESFRGEEGPDEKADISRGWLLLTLSVATSIDALAVGLTFAFMKVNIWMASLIIGMVAFVVTATGFQIGKKASDFLGERAPSLGNRAELIGGLILIGIGIEIVLQHFAWL